MSTITGISQIEPIVEPVAQRINRRVTRARPTLSNVLLLVIIFSMGFMSASRTEIVA
jgi:hypothetical protein